MCAVQLAWNSRRHECNGFIKGIPIRKVYFAPVLPQIAEHIKQYFHGFGAVESMHPMHDNRRSKFGFVQYQSIEAAKAVLLHPKHCVANYTLTVKAAYDVHQPDYNDYIKFKAPEQDSPLHIHNALIDDCLERVFKQFDLVDLAVAADVCVRFQLHAIDAFEKKYKHVVKMVSEDQFVDDPELVDHQLEMVLRNFGSMIHSLSIDGRILDDRPLDNTLKQVNEYAPAIKHLQLNFFDVDCALPLFANLEKLDLIDCICKDGNEKLFASCSELKYLRIGGYLWEDCPIDHTFPKLEEVYLNFYAFLSDTELGKFLASNPTIKKLRTYGMTSWHPSRISTVAVIVQHLKNLEELNIYQYQLYCTNGDPEMFRGLGQLSLLKKLSLGCNGISVASLLNELVENAVPLEYLSLEIGLVDSSAIRTMCKLTKLNEIKLSYIAGVTDDHCIELAKKLPRLHTLHLRGSTAEHITIAGLRTMLSHAKMLSYLTLEEAANIQSIGMSDYRSLLKSVQDRSEKIKLEIKITGDGSKVDVPGYILSANRLALD